MDAYRHILFKLFQPAILLLVLIPVSGISYTAGAHFFQGDGVQARTTNPDLAASDGFLLNDQRFIDDVQQAIDLVYNQQFDASLELMQPWFDTGRAEPIREFWHGLPLWWEILADLESEAFDDAFISIMEDANRASDSILRRERQNLDALVIKSLANGFLARLYANRLRWYKSLTHGRQAISLLFTIEKLYPDVPDIQFGLGLYNYFTAHLNQEYRLVRAVSWMIPSGNKPEGLERLAEAAENSAYMRPEANYFLGHIYLNYENQPVKAEKYLTDLVSYYPYNAFFNRLMLRTFYQQRQFGQAVVLNEGLIERFEHLEHAPTMEELWTMRGMLHYRNMQLDDSELMLEKAMELSGQLEGGENRHQQLLARYHLARIYIRTDRIDEAREFYQSIVEADTDSPLKDRARRMLRQMQDGR